MKAPAEKPMRFKWSATLRPQVDRDGFTMALRLVARRAICLNQRPDALNIEICNGLG